MKENKTSREEVDQNLIDEGFNRMQRDIIIDKYINTDIINGKLAYIDKSYSDICRRISQEIYPLPSDIDKKKKIYNHLVYKNYIFGGSITAVAGTNKLQSLSNCFVIPSAKDDYGSILKTETEQISLMKRRGGVGHDLSNIRPKGMPVHNAAKVSAGVVPMMKRYSRATEEVAQNGRRGALMLSISVYHPDILDFIRAKRESDTINGANISVRVDNAFFDSLERNSPINTHFPVGSDNPIFEKTISSKLIFDTISESMRDSAEPGLLFWDKIVEREDEIVSTNPCGEIPLPGYDSCILGHINLFSYVAYPFSTAAFFDYETFEEDVKFYTETLDRVVDLEIKIIDKILLKLVLDPISSDIEYHTWSKIKAQKKEHRRIGQGITGLWDMFAALQLSHPKEILSITEEIMSIKNRVEMQTSESLGRDVVASDIIAKYNEEYELNINSLSNIAISTIAPVGTGSLILGTTSGMEPLFMKEMERRVISSGKEKIIKIKHLPTTSSIPDNYLSYYLEAHQVNPEFKIDLQGLIQKYTHSAISVTHNLPEETEASEIRDLIIQSYEAGNKGFTVYVDGSREGIIGKTLERQDKGRRKIEERGKELKGRIFKYSKGDKTFNIVVGLKNGIPYEIFSLHKKDFALPESKCVITKNKDKTYTLSTEGEGVIQVNISLMYDRSSTELLTRHISKRLRYEKLEKVTEDFDKSLVLFGTFEHSLYRALKFFLKDSNQSCPVCGNKLTYEEGCLKCYGCGYSKC